MSLSTSLYFQGFYLEKYMLSILVSLFARRWGWDPYFRGFATFKGIATQGRNTQGNLSLWHVATTDHSLEKDRAISSSNTSGRQIASCVREISQENLFPRQNFVAPRKVTQNHSANPLLNLCDLFVCLFFFSISRFTNTQNFERKRDRLKLSLSPFVGRLLVGCLLTDSRQIFLGTVLQF